MQDNLRDLKEAREQLNKCITAYKKIGRELAQAEFEYRKALRQEIIRLHIEDDVAWTVCDTLAKGDDNVAQLRLQRDIKKSDYESCYEKILQLKTEIRIIEGDIEAERKGI